MKLNFKMSLSSQYLNIKIRLIEMLIMEISLFHYNDYKSKCHFTFDCLCCNLAYRYGALYTSLILILNAVMLVVKTYILY